MMETDGELRQKHKLFIALCENKNAEEDKKEPIAIFPNWSFSIFWVFNSKEFQDLLDTRID